MKIAVPWPVKTSSQERIRESLDLWEDKSVLLLCLVEPCDDPFLKDYDTTVLARNTTDIGTKIPKCYIHDMVKAVRDLYPNEDWYGFGNSDCVPVGDIVEGHTDYETLVYHRTDIQEWPFRYKQVFDRPIERQLADKIWQMRQDGLSDKKIARQLNRSEVTPPGEHTEWTYDIIREIFVDQGNIFFWGQDMYLFRADVVDKVLTDYLRVVDPILGTGGFDPRLTKYCIDNFKGARILNKIFHKIHQSEWTVDEVEYAHNGGDIVMDERTIYYDQTFILSLCEKGQKGAIPKYIRYLIGRKNPELQKFLAQ